VEQFHPIPLNDFDSNDDFQYALGIIKWSSHKPAFCLR